MRSSNISGLRVYVSGDTEDIPEMRDLEDIDVACVCMTLACTMDVERAAERRMTVPRASRVMLRRDAAAILCCGGPDDGAVSRPTGERHAAAVCGVTGKHASAGIPCQSRLQGSRSVHQARAAT